MKIRLTHCRGGRYEAHAAELPDAAPGVGHTRHEAVGDLLTRMLSVASSVGLGWLPRVRLDQPLAFEEVEAVFPPVTWTGDSFPVRGRGDCFTAKLLLDTTREALNACVGEVIEWPDKRRAEVIGFETFAVPELRAGMPIGVLRALTGLRSAIQACYDRGEDPVTGAPLD